MTTPKETAAPRTLQEIYQDALRLSPEEREKLACMLENDLDDWYATPEIAQAWNEEIARRIKAIDDGTAKLQDGEKVFRELRRKYAL
jgi:DNA phosphorothioation-dependent restriction protein DptG